MQSQVIGNLLLPVPVLLHCLGNRLISFPSLIMYTIRKYFCKSRPVHVPLAFRDLGYVFMLFKVIKEAVNKFILSEERLSLDVCPDRFLSYAPSYKLPVFFLCLGSISAELSE